MVVNTEPRCISLQVLTDNDFLSALSGIYIFHSQQQQQRTTTTRNDNENNNDNSNKIVHLSSRSSPEKSTSFTKSQPENSVRISLVSIYQPVGTNGILEQNSSRVISNDYSKTQPFARKEPEQNHGFLQRHCHQTCIPLLPSPD